MQIKYIAGNFQVIISHGSGREKIFKSHGMYNSLCRKMLTSWISCFVSINACLPSQRLKACAAYTGNFSTILSLRLNMLLARRHKNTMPWTSFWKTGKCKYTKFKLPCECFYGKASYLYFDGLRQVASLSFFLLWKKQLTVISLVHGNVRQRTYKLLKWGLVRLSLWFPYQ